MQWPPLTDQPADRARSNLLQDLPFPSTGDLSAMNVGAVSPSFGSSDNSLHSDFTGVALLGLQHHADQ